ncbi:MAG: LamG domain-containing protein [Planctomycetia bacterium]|nr:LamG domain-containing protein [Planctomycetia bacterium]
MAKNAFGSVHTGNVAVDPVSPNVVYAGSYAGSYGLSNGVFRSTDYGLTWTNISGNLGSAFNCTTLQVNPYTRYVYAGGFHGTWKLPPPSSTSTADTLAPNCSININNGNTYTNSGTATLTLSATDDVGVIGYYLSTSSPTPLASAPGWTSVVSTANYSGTVSYTLSSGDGTKTVYVWYKDAAGNVSNAASDSIILDTTVNTVTGLNALYLFDEKSGSTAKDYSGNGNTGILFNGTVWTKGKINNALFFDGVNDYVEVPNSESINPSKAVTVSAWIYPIAPGQSQDSKIISKRHQTLSNDNYSLGFTSTNRPQARVIVGGGPKIINGPVLSLNAWHHLVGVYNGSTLKLYVNGVEVASTTAAGSIDSSTHPLRIGTRAFDPADRYFQGNIDDVRIYSLALSDQEVQDLHRSAEMVTVSMQARYMFEEGAGTIATDLSGNNRNGTITGATWTTGKIGGGLNFDGNDYVTIPRVNYDEISVSAWFNKNTSGTNVIFGGFRYNANVQLQEGFDLYFQSGTPNSLRFAVATRNVSGTTTVKEAIKVYQFRMGVGIMWLVLQQGYRRTEVICGRAVGEYTSTSIGECGGAINGPELYGYRNKIYRLGVFPWKYRRSHYLQSGVERAGGDVFI